MAVPFTLSGSLDYQPDDGQPVAKRPFSQSGQFDSKGEADLQLTGAGTHVVDFGTIAKAKAMSIEVASTSLAPVDLIFNGGAEEIELSPGGFMVISSPAPDVGISALSITHSDNARVQVRILG